MRFKVVPLPVSQFDAFLKADDNMLPTYGSEWRVVDEYPGFPCRVSLIDAEVGERVLLINVAFHDVNSPYRASGPIFVRENAVTAKLPANTLPTMLLHRTLSVRAYNANHLMVNAMVVHGEKLAETVKELFANERSEYIHIHNAAAGCFICAVHRV